MFRLNRNIPAMPTDMRLRPAWAVSLHPSQVMRPLKESIIGATGRSKIRPLREGSVVSVDPVIHLMRHAGVL